MRDSLDLNKNYEFIKNKEDNIKSIDKKLNF